MKIALVVVLVALLAVTMFLLVSSTHTALEVEPLKMVGTATPLHVRAANPHGERSLQVTVQQDGKSYTLAPIMRPSRIWMVERHAAPVNTTFAVGTQSVKELHDGKAQIIVTSVSERPAWLARQQDAGCGSNGLRRREWPRMARNDITLIRAAPNWWYSRRAGPGRKPA